MEKQASEGGKQLQRRRQWMRAILVIIVALVLGAAGYLLFEALWRAHLETISEIAMPVAHGLG